VLPVSCRRTSLLTAVVLALLLHSGLNLGRVLARFLELHAGPNLRPDVGLFLHLGLLPGPRLDLLASRRGHRRGPITRQAVAVTVAITVTGSVAVRVAAAVPEPVPRLVLDLVLVGGQRHLMIVASPLELVSDRDAALAAAAILEPLAEHVPPARFVGFRHRERDRADRHQEQRRPEQ
jgi:hypothetical protein